AGRIRSASRRSLRPECCSRRRLAAEAACSRTCTELHCTVSRSLAELPVLAVPRSVAVATPCVPTPSGGAVALFSRRQTASALSGLAAGGASSHWLTPGAPRRG